MGRQKWILVLAAAGLLGLGCAGRGAGEKDAAAGSPDVSGYDLSTDEGVQAAYRHVTGADRHAYVHRLEGIQEIVIVNDRWPDHGDVFQGAFIAHRWYPDGNELGPALTQLGWEEADAQRRVEIARIWIERSRRYGQVIHEPLRDPIGRDDPAPSEIRPPVYEATDDGGVRADFWVVTGWGIAGQPLYAHRRLLFDSSAHQVE